MTTTGTSVSEEMDISSLYDVPGVHAADRINVPVYPWQVRNAQMLIRQSGVVRKLSEWRQEDGYDPSKGGRPAEFNDEHILVLLMVLALEGQPLEFTNVRDLVFYRLTNDALTQAGIRRFDRVCRNPLKALYAQLLHAFHRVLDPMDPHPDDQQFRCYDKTVWEELENTRDQALVAARKARLAEAGNAFIRATLDTAPKRFMDAWDGTVAVDATHIPMVRKGTSKDSSTASSAPWAGWYVRSHAVIRNASKTRETVKWAMDAALAVMASPGPSGDYPHLVLGMSLDKPGVAPAANGRIAMSNVLAGDYPRGFLVGDQIYYPQSKAEDWNIPMRKVGYAIVGNLSKDDHEIQGEYKGAELIDGIWYCPGMPPALKTATLDYLAEKQHLAAQAAAELAEAKKRGRAAVKAAEEAAAKRVNAVEMRWREKLARRNKKYRLRPKEAPRDNGSQCFKCPAVGPGATLDCPLKPRAPQAKKCARTKINTPPKNPGPLCTNKNSLAIPIEVSAKFVQALPWESPEWQNAYSFPRNTIEAKNAFLKAEDGGSIAATARRRVRGLAAQYILLAIMVAAENVRAVENYLRKEREQALLQQPPDDPARRPVRQSSKRVPPGEENKKATGPPAAA